MSLYLYFFFWSVSKVVRITSLRKADELPYTGKNNNDWGRSNWDRFSKACKTIIALQNSGNTYHIALGAILLIITNEFARAQVTFTDASGRLPNVSTPYSFLHQAVADMNRDGREDIVRADQTGKFYLLLQQVDGSFTQKTLGQIQSSTPLAIVLADLNNDHYPDILTGGQYNGVRVLSSQALPLTYQTSRLPNDTIFTQAAAVADLNRDGLLDVFVCHDEGTSALWRNLGNGNFVRDNLGINLNTVPASDNSGNYGSVFTDFDNDDDLDLYISKCSRFAPHDSLDPRRINQLFVNQGNGLFLEQAKRFGLADSSQTWITEFQDIDNDGDLDAFIANHHGPSRLMLNNGHGYFADITASAGLLGTVPDGILHALMQDFDNDGYMDLLVSGMMEAKFFRNNGNRTFSVQPLSLTNPTGTAPLRSFVWGDFDQNGFQDLYTSYFYGGNDPDRLWLNSSNNGNHYLKITLQGTKSNFSSVGARITAQVGTQTLIREVRAGESFGLSNSLTQIIGLGPASIIDHLSIQWPSGQRMEQARVAANQWLTLTEPNCTPSKCIPLTLQLIK